MTLRLVWLFVLLLVLFLPCYCALVYVRLCVSVVFAFNIGVFLGISVLGCVLVLAFCIVSGRVCRIVVVLVLDIMMGLALGVVLDIVFVLLYLSCSW